MERESSDVKKGNDIFKYLTQSDSVNTAKDIITDFNVNFGKVEQIKNFELLADEWTVENGLLTATMKLRRKIIKEKYKELIDTFYNKIS